MQKKKMEHSKKTEGLYPASPWLRRFQDALFKLFQGTENKYAEDYPGSNEPEKLHPDSQIKI